MSPNDFKGESNEISGQPSTSTGIFTSPSIKVHKKRKNKQWKEIQTAAAKSESNRKYPVYSELEEDDFEDRIDFLIKREQEKGNSK